MNSVQAGFDILYVIAHADGEMDRSEVEIIKEFLEDNYREQFDVKSEVRELDALGQAGKYRRFREAAEFVLDNSSEASRYKLVDFALDLLAADGEVSEGEMRLFTRLGDVWEMDVLTYVSERLG